MKIFLDFSSWICYNIGRGEGFIMAELLFKVFRVLFYLGLAIMGGFGLH